MTGREDFKRMIFEPTSDDKFYISEITGTKTDKNDVRYYKVKWDHMWIPASRLRAWQDLIIQFWEGYHANNNQKIMEIDSPCEQTPQVYVLTSDSESREEIQVVASTNSEKRESATEEDISSSVNFDNYPEEGGGSDPDDMYLDNDKISILGHKRVKILKQKQPRPNALPAPDSAESQARRSDEDQSEQQKYLFAERDRLKQEMLASMDRDRERIKDEHYNQFARIDAGPPHLAPNHRSSFISMEKTVSSSRDLYNSPTYRMPVSPTSTRNPHDLQVVSSYSIRRNSISPHDPHSMFDALAPPKKAFYCYLCGKEYRSGTGLKQHLLAHKNEKPFGCNICHRRYRWKGDLNRHMYTHLPNNELPLKCPECNKGFVRKDKMQLHINFAHGGSNTSNNSNNEDIKPRSIGTTPTTATPVESQEEKSNYPAESNKYPAESNKYPAESNKYPAESNKYPAESSQYQQENNHYTPESSQYSVENNQYPQESSNYPSENNQYPLEQSNEATMHPVPPLIENMQ